MTFYEKYGKFELPSRGNDFLEYSEVLMQLCMVKKGVHLTKSEDKAKRIAVVLMETRKHLQRGTFIQQRTIYYIHKVLFEFKSWLAEDTVNEVGSLLGSTRTSLNITVSSSGGSVIGPVVLYAGKRVKIDCSRSGTGGSKIPHEAHQIDKIKASRTISKVHIGC